MARITDPDGHEIEVLRRLVSFDGKDVLDIGCGDGRTARYIARAARSVIGIDSDAERIAVARDTESENGSCPIDFRVEDAVAREWPAARFDAVVFSRSL